MLENIPSYFFAVIMLGSVLLGLLGLAWALVEILCGIFPGLIPTRQTAHVVTRPRTQPAQPRIIPRLRPQKITPDLVANARETEPIKPRPVDPLVQKLFYNREAPLGLIIAALPRLSFRDLQARQGYAFTLHAGGNFLVGFRSGKPLTSTFASRAIHFADLKICCVYGRFFQKLNSAEICIYQIETKVSQHMTVLSYGKPRGVGKAIAGGEIDFLDFSRSGSQPGKEADSQKIVSGRKGEMQ